MEIKCYDFGRSDLQYKFSSSVDRHQPPMLQFAVTAIIVTQPSSFKIRLTLLHLLR